MFAARISLFRFCFFLFFFSFCLLFSSFFEILLSDLYSCSHCMGIFCARMRSFPKVFMLSTSCAFCIIFASFSSALVRFCFTTIFGHVHQLC
jgi:hypothetical protein